MTLCTRNKILATIGLCVLVLAVATLPALAQTAIPTTATQFDMTGFLQSATLNSTDAKCALTSGSPQNAALCGGTLKVNGHDVTVPANTIVILPANALTWAELFTKAPSAQVTAGVTGLAMNDGNAKLFGTYEVEVVGNRVGNQYIAGLVYLSQQGLNSGQGFINFIDYSKGEIWVGGPQGSSSGARVSINDPALVPCAATDAVCISTAPATNPGFTGRFSKGISPDPRFMVDQDNPTIASATGFPMCLPRIQPGTVVNGVPTEDPLCPEENRPAGALTVQMVNPVTSPGLFPDATKQAPMEVGDYITYAGTLENDGSDYISAHTITNNTAIFTWAGTSPAYVATEVALIGTGGLTVIGAGEAAIRTRFEGMSTDPTRNVHLYGIDLNPLTGAPTDRDWGTIGVDQVTVKGRWRFRPPCTATTATVKACTPPPGGSFLPPTREVRAVVEGAWVPGQTTTYANGIIAGQYHAPILEYIFPENLPGTPIVPNNFEAIDFLAKGGYTSSTGTLVGQLNPWPGDNAPPPPTPTCTAPTANAGGPYTVANAGTVVLNGSATGTAPLTYAWTATAGSFSDPTLPSPTYTGPGVGGPQTLTLTVTGSCGSPALANATVTENAPTAPTVNPIANVTVLSGNQVTLTATATGAGPITFQWSQTSGANVTMNPVDGKNATITFNPTLPLNTITPATLGFQVVATNAGGSSAPGTVTVTVKPLPDSIAITTAQYRTGKQRLDLTVTDTPANPNVILTLQPYVTITGATFDPSILGNTLVSAGAGTYTMTLVGAPEPQCSNPNGTNATPCSAKPLVVKSNVGGASPNTALTNIRQ